METEIVIAVIFDCALMLGISWYYKKYPPKKINELYGYRTRRSMANQDIWDAANKRNAQDLWKYALYLTGISALLIIFNIPYTIIIHMVVLLLGLFLAIYSTIVYVDKHFDKNGNRKNHE